MKLCFVSVNGPRETYFVDEPRIKKKVMFLGSKVRPVHVADNLTAIYEPIV
jgi:hypothetical protein